MASPSFNLQLGTLLPIFLGVTVVRVLAMWHYALHHKVYPGFRTMLLAELLVFLGMVVLPLRDWLGLFPPLVFLVNAVVLAHPVLVYHGLGAYGRMPRLAARTRWAAVFVGVTGLLQVADALLAPSLPRRILIFSLAGFLLTLRIGVELPWKCRRKLPGMRLLACSYLIMTLFHLLRAANAYNLPTDSFWALLQADTAAVYSISFRILQSVLELYVVFAMNSAMLEGDLQLATSQIERMAQTDPLTGALNRRGLELLGREALRRSAAEGAPAALVMFDLDRFKLVNDTLGHAAGDELLRDVAAICRYSLRGEDVFARYGGEEFVMVAPFTSEEEGRLLAERVRAAIEKERFIATEGRLVTASFGVASTRAGTLAALLGQADKALYVAKQSGRNRVVAAKAQTEVVEGQPEEA